MAVAADPGIEEASAEASVRLETSPARGALGRMNSTEPEELRGGRVMLAVLIVFQRPVGNPGGRHDEYSSKVFPQ
jgi:hypothetical protein